MSERNIAPSPSEPPPGKRIATLVYALQAAAFVVGFTLIIGVIINYVKRDDVRGTWLESHFRWQIRTFWFNLLWTVLGLITLPFGYFVLFADGVWVLYRIIKGWMRLHDNKPLYT